MPEKKIVEKAKQDLRQGKSPSTAAGKFVREEIHRVRQGKHGLRSPAASSAPRRSSASQRTPPATQPCRATPKPPHAAAP